MMAESRKQLQEPVTLEEETVSFGGMMLEYRLLASDTVADKYRIRIISGGERSESCVGSHIDSALKCYRAVVSGRVTPCGLQDVMYDLNRCL